MARINIEDCWWTDPRRSALVRALGGEGLADGCAIRAWRLAQEFWKRGRGLVPRALFESLEGAQAILSTGLAEPRGDEIYVRGSSAYLEWVHERRKAAAKGGKKSAQRPRDARGRLTKTSKQTPGKDEAKTNQTQVSASGSFSVSGSFSDSGSSSEVSKFENLAPDERRSARSRIWEAYAKAYEAEHGAAPPRSKTANSLIKRFSERVPIDEGPGIAAYYVRSNNAYYLQKYHPLELLVADAQKLRTEWVTGRRITQTQARENDRSEAIRETVKEYLNETGGA